MSYLKNLITKLASEKPELRKHLVPILKTAVGGFQADVFKDSKLQKSKTLPSLQKAADYAAGLVRGRGPKWHSEITDLRTGKKVSGLHYVEIWDNDQFESVTVFPSYAKAKAYANKRQVLFGITLQIINMETGRRV